MCLKRSMSPDPTRRREDVRRLRRPDVDAHRGSPDWPHSSWRRWARPATPMPAPRRAKTMTTRRAWWSACLAIVAAGSLVCLSAGIRPVAGARNSAAPIVGLGPWRCKSSAVLFLACTICQSICWRSIAAVFRIGGIVSRHAKEELQRPEAQCCIKTGQPIVSQPSAGSRAGDRPLGEGTASTAPATAVIRVFARNRHHSTRRRNGSHSTISTPYLFPRLIGLPGCALLRQAHATWLVASSDAVTFVAEEEHAMPG